MSEVFGRKSQIARTKSVDPGSDHPSPESEDAPKRFSPQWFLSSRKSVQLGLPQTPKSPESPDSPISPTSPLPSPTIRKPGHRRTFSGSFKHIRNKCNNAMTSPNRPKTLTDPNGDQRNYGQGTSLSSSSSSLESPTVFTFPMAPVQVRVEPIFESNNSATKGKPVPPPKPPRRVKAPIVKAKTLDEGEMQSIVKVDANVLHSIAVSQVVTGNHQLGLNPIAKSNSCPNNAIKINPSSDNGMKKVLMSSPQLLRRSPGVIRRKLGMENNVLVGPGPMTGTGTGIAVNGRGVITKQSIKETNEFFDMLEKSHKQRLDDQRCELKPFIAAQTHSGSSPIQSSRAEEMKTSEATVSSTGPAVVAPPIPQITPTQRLQQVLRGPAPYPMVSLPTTGYWCDGWVKGGSCTYEGPPLSTSPAPCLEVDEIAQCYRKYFLGKEHLNFIAQDDNLGPVLLSMKTEVIGGQELYRLLLRLQSGTCHELVPASCFSDQPTPFKMAKRLKEELTCEKFVPVLVPNAASLIVAYDEHVLVSEFKFGLLHQRVGQVHEEQIFANQSTSPALDEFMALLGRRVPLKDHKGYKGGLDTQFGQTGTETLYEVFREKEIMFHVAPLLPYADHDPQQLQRKRHIGNDIVAIVFQEGNTPFAPDMIASHFLHAFIVVEPINPQTNNTRYKVSVTARDDVPHFFPSLPSPAIFQKNDQFKDFLLTKLLNAEHAAYKGDKFATLHRRTRIALLTTLVSNLKAKTNDFVGPLFACPSLTAVVQPETPTKNPEAGSKFIDTVRKVWSTSRSKQNVNGNGTNDARSETGSWKSSSGHWSGSAESTPASTLKLTVSKIPYKGGNAVPSQSPPSSPGLDTPPLRTPRLALMDSDDSSLNSLESEGMSGQNGHHHHPLLPNALQGATTQEDSDTGLESLSSTEANNGFKSCSCGGRGEGEETKALKVEVHNLKEVKLDLLRQNVNCQRDIKRLMEKEKQLQTELVAASREIHRLRLLLKEGTVFEGSPV